MKDPIIPFKINSEPSSGNVFSLAMIVGFLMFLIAFDQTSGLAAVQVFVAGFFGVIVCYVLICLAANQSARTAEQGHIYLNVPGHASITRIESEEGVTLQIYVSNSPSAK